VGEGWDRTHREREVVHSLGDGVRMGKNSFRMQICSLGGPRCQQTSLKTGFLKA